VEARHYNYHSLSYFSLRNGPWSNIGTEHSEPCSRLRLGHYVYCLAHRLFPARGWSCWYTICGISKDIGQETPFSLRDAYTHIFKRWAGASSASYKSILWARIIQGVSTAPFETLVNATVGDLYFVHLSIHTLPLSLPGCPSLLTCNLLGERQAHGFDKPSGFWRCLLHSYPRRQDHKYDWMALDFLLCLDLLRHLFTLDILLCPRDSFSPISPSQY
jgi:hypothetical protein